MAQKDLEREAALYDGSSAAQDELTEDAESYKGGVSSLNDFKKYTNSIIHVM